VSKKILIIFSVVVLLVGGLFVACDGEDDDVNGDDVNGNGVVNGNGEPILPDDYDTRESIVIGAARPISGPLNMIGDFAFGPVLNIWVDDVNARGGIYVDEYDRSLPIDLIIYDDTSDMGTMTTLLERLILEDEVDFIMPPCSTAFLYAAGPIANNYEYIFLGGEGGCTTLTALLPDLPYTFGVLNYSDYNQIPVMADLFVEWGVETVAYIYIADLHGIEYAHTSEAEFLQRGIQVVYSEGVLPTALDLTPQLKAARDSGADAFCSYTYPPISIFVYGQAIELGYSPDVFVIGPGANFQFYYDIFGPMTEGLISFGAWNRQTSPEADAFADMTVAALGDLGLAVYGDEEAFVDWWGGLFYWGALQFFEQAIVEAGTLDQSVIRDVMATSTFTTALGPTWFDMTADGAGGGLLALECHPGQLGQWQDGIFEVIGPAANATAPAIYPKPPFPAP